MSTVEHDQADQSSNGRFASWWACDILRGVHGTCDLSPTARALLLLLAGYANAAHYCDPSVDHLADALGLKARVVQRARAELVAAGLVRVLRGGGGGHGPKATNGYWLAVTGHPPAAARGVVGDTPRQSTGVSPATPSIKRTPREVIHRGVVGDGLGVSSTTPKVDSEVSRDAACVFTRSCG